MSQDLIIPWRDIDCRYRQCHFDFLCNYYSKDFNIVIGDNDGEFNRSAARNAGVRKSTSDISIIVDADNYIPLDQIHLAIEKANKKDLLVKPFFMFGYLTKKSTNYFYDYGMFEDAPEFMNPPSPNFTGGAYVIKKKIWESLGGMDEEFIGWGAEDDAFHILCKNKLGKIVYIDGYDYHLYHPADRKISERNYDRLMINYVRNKKI